MQQIKSWSATATFQVKKNVSAIVVAASNLSAMADTKVYFLLSASSTVTFSEKKCYVRVSFDQHVASFFFLKNVVFMFLNSQVLTMTHLRTESLKPLRVACFLCL